MPINKIKNMKKKRTKKPEYPIYTIGSIIILIVVVIFVILFLPKKLRPKETTTTSTIVSSAPTTSSVTTTTIKIQTCGNFKWNIDDNETFDIAGDFRILSVSFTAQYTGTKEENYGLAGAYKFKILDSIGRYYNPLENYLLCSYSNKFEIGTVWPGYRMSGCLEFSVSDFTEPTKLVFYDYVVNPISGSMCEIDLS